MKNSSALKRQMQRVQDYFADQLQTIDESNQMVVSEPTFVQLPPAITEPNPITHRVAPIICGIAHIEISEDISEEFLLKLIGVISHAQ